MHMDNYEQQTTPFRERIALLIGDEKPYSWAARVGISKGGFAQIWNNQTSTPHRATVQRICDATGASFEWLMHGKGEPFPGKADAEPQSATQEPPSAAPVEPEQSGKVAGTITPRSVDLETMKFVDQVLEEWLQERGLRLKPERRAGVLAVLCDYLAKGATAKDLQEMLKVLSA